MEVGTYNWNWHYTLLNDTIFILGTSEDSDLTKLFRITTSVKKVAISNLSANAYQQTLFKTNLPFIALNPLEQSRNFLVVIFDSRGKRVFSQKGLANMLIPDKFKSGIYYLSVSDNNGVLLKRQFVIDR